MSTAMSTTILRRLRADADDTTGNIFTDAEIIDIWERVDAADSEAQQHDAALALMYFQLRNSAVKFTKYTAGQTSVEKQQIFDHLHKVYLELKPTLDKVMGRATQQMVKAKLRPRFRADRLGLEDNAEY